MKTLRSQRANYRVNRGDTFEETLYLEDEDGETITTEWTWRFTVRSSIPSTSTTDDTDATISETGTFSNGTSTLTISSDDMDIDAGEYYFDFQLTKPDGTIHSTFYGDFIVESDITRHQES
jgi:hypothetical protein